VAYEYFDCEVTDILDATERTKRFFFRFPKEVDFSFRAGQFVMLNLPIKSKITNRAYSIASSPATDNSFELIISRKPVGLGTKYLFDEVKKGSMLQATKALGKFSLPEPIEYDLCFVCTGTGVAPLRSMLHHIYETNISHRNIYLIFGNRWERDILYREEFEELARKHEEFKFIPVLSRETQWEGMNGYVHPVYEELFADKHPAYFYVCGWEAMTKEARHRIAAMGYEKKFIRFEVYD
jgi:CDP-4-dehydro-6-deoxyglucose reductase